MNQQLFVNNLIYNLDKTFKEIDKLKMAKKSQETSTMLNLDDIIAQARSGFKNKDKGLGLQISTGADVFVPTDDSDFICWPDSHWQQLTGVRGLPFGKAVQIAGRPDSGKSSHAMAFMLKAQQQGCYVILWDSEKKFSATRFDRHFKGDSKKLLLVQSKLIREGSDEVKALIDAIMTQDPNAKILLVWDSVGGTLSKSEAEKEAREGHQMAEASKENGMAIRGFVFQMEKFRNPETNKENIAILLINQVYANIGAPGQKESGGQKIEFHSSIILQLTRKSDLTKMKAGVKMKTGIVTRARVKKNHLFDGEESVAELLLAVTAGDVRLLDAVKTKKKEGETGWEDDEDVEEVE